MIKKEDLVESGVIFLEDTHQYFLDGVELQGITQSLIHRAFPDTYANIPEEVLMRAAEKGSNIHETIQFCEENGFPGQTPEWLSYAKIKADNHLHYITHEYIVTDRVKFASAIDLVMVDDEGKIVLCDIKTTSVRHYDNVTLQLSIYKRYFEAQNPNLKVDRIALIWVRDDDYEYRELTPWADEALDYLFECDKLDVPFELAKIYGDLPVKFAEVEDEVAFLQMQADIANSKLDELKKGLYELMEKNNVKSWTGSKVRLTRILPTTSDSFDSKRFKEEQPELYKKYTKTSKKNGSLRMTIVN